MSIKINFAAGVKAFFYGVMEILNWLTDKLQVKVLLAMLALAGIAYFCIDSAIVLVMSEGFNTEDGIQYAEVVIASLFSVAIFALGALATLSKDLITPAPGKSEGHDLFALHMRLEHGIESGLKPEHGDNASAPEAERDPD